ncbi:MAG: glycosyltransferase [Anaerolineales bacterium]|nr:glycosyltransferase [Anaerolineales bacterium]
MSKLRVHIVYEHSLDRRPFGSAYLRLLRPFSHPTVTTAIEAQASWDYSGEAADLVIVDRFWRPDVSLRLAEELVQRVRRAGARLVYTLDDDLLSLPVGPPNGIAPQQVAAVKYFLGCADAVWVTTAPLGERIQPYNDRVEVLANALDERLIAVRSPSTSIDTFDPTRLVIGYMGTPTHTGDLAMILPALQRVFRRHAGRLVMQLVGVTSQPEMLSAAGIPVRIVAPQAVEGEYPRFMLWFTSALHWDIALAPLAETLFNQSKSAIKALDYAALGATGVYSNAPAYRDVVHQRETGLLAGSPAEWEEALEILIADAALRTALSHAAARNLWEQHVLERCGQRWVDAAARAAGRRQPV